MSDARTEPTRLRVLLLSDATARFEPVALSASEMEAWRAAARAAAAVISASTSDSDSAAPPRPLPVEPLGVREDLRTEAGGSAASREVTVFRPRVEFRVRLYAFSRDDSASDSLSSPSLATDDGAREAARVVRIALVLLAAGVRVAFPDTAGARDDDRPRECLRLPGSFSDAVS